MLVRLDSNLVDYTEEDRIKHSFTHAGIEYTYCCVDECDIFLCSNHPHSNISVKCSEAWIHSTEPPARIRNWERETYKHFDRVFSTWPDYPDPLPPCLSNHIKLSNEELEVLAPIAKTKTLSWITSSNKDLYGHRLRLKLVAYLDKVGYNYDLFGRGFTEIENKFDALKDYKYSIAIENFSTDYYFTEKITDCLLSWAIPFYWGATNIDKFFPKGSYIPIDPNKPQHALDIINEYTSSNYYEENLELIREARDIILEKYQYIYRFSNIINSSFTPNKPRTQRNIPIYEHPSVVGGYTKLKYKFNCLLSKHFKV